MLKHQATGAKASSCCAFGSYDRVNLSGSLQLT